MHCLFDYERNSMMQAEFEYEAQRKWGEARRRAFWANFRAHLVGKGVGLFDLNEVAQQLRLRNVRYLGIQTVPISKIVGSVGRYQDFTATFLPIHESMKNRWQHIAAVSLNPQDSLPPIEVYKVGAWYFVRDGNHRVSVAHQIGITHLDAAVWEYTDLWPEATASTTDIQTMLLMAEYRAFQENTRLDDLRPGHNIRLSEPGGYEEMMCQIAHYQHVLSQIDGVETSYEEAVTAWYDMIYETSVQLIHDEGVLGLFPDRTPADFFVWTTHHRQELESRYAHNVFVRDAVRDLRKHDLKLLAKWMWHKVYHSIVRREKPS